MVRQKLLPAVLLLFAFAANAWSQGIPDPAHYWQRANMPPGAIGRYQLQRGGPLPGYFQPVEVHAPEGVRVSVLNQGAFPPGETSPVKAGMLIGGVYRLKITNIPRWEGVEVYPTIEVVNRLYPPAGKEIEFPIPVEITADELRYAIGGKFVTRVIYLEEPTTALAVRGDLGQRYYEVGPHQDPLREADRLGRPMAILRMGSKIPSNDELQFGSWPVMPLPKSEAEEEAPAEDAAPEEQPAPVDEEAYYRPHASGNYRVMPAQHQSSSYQGRNAGR